MRLLIQTMISKDNSFIKLNKVSMFSSSVKEKNNTELTRIIPNVRDLNRTYKSKTVNTRNPYQTHMSYTEHKIYTERTRTIPNEHELYQTYKSHTEVQEHNECIL